MYRNLLALMKILQFAVAYSVAYMRKSFKSVCTCDSRFKFLEGVFLVINFSSSLNTLYTKLYQHQLNLKSSGQICCWHFVYQPIMSFPSSTKTKSNRKQSQARFTLAYSIRRPRFMIRLRQPQKKCKRYCQTTQNENEMPLRNQWGKPTNIRTGKKVSW